MKNKDTLFTVVLFYVGWFGSVFLARSIFSFVSLLFPLILIGFLALREILNRRNFAFSIAVSIIGILFDFVMIHKGFVAAIGGPVWFIPVWLVAIWLLFSFSIIKLGPNLNIPIWLSVLLGMIMGPLSYKSGEAFNVLSFSSTTTFVIYACFWGLSFPLILKLSKRYL